ncbi:hypothetical protein MF672_039075 [Actinomadura sp. ATCC 31491]|uniref:Uncharacterized protein n=1 Tax=Actinomadura luzonensis TaxID=2805427 RepID=A0ABT0G568_9ACTN|nr:hypothetical protein [Actinomadura luzonensis]MCK2219758.1 hypothetical protein [Actinomadura luzonensis]
MSRHTPDGFDSQTQADWYGGQFKEPKRRGRPRKPATAAAAAEPLPPVGNPAWGVPIYGKDLRIGDFLVHLHRDFETRRITRFEPYKGGLPLASGARTACSGRWEIAVGPYQIVRILPRDGAQ